ncbi:hypothetical protein [Rudanella lutea]|uniref:hypothetical protein n=1 Tax=Rudanella lutea TaxID=451374 RepID=UPI0003822F34|nr:hypothetical protein [Rudanella lutea]
MLRIGFLLLCLMGSSLAGFGQKATVKRTPKTATSPLTYKGRVITVTTGGGFTGRSTSYSLQDDGRLYGKRSTDAAYALLGKQSAPNTRRVFWSLEDRCKIKTTQFDNPGNTYKAVSWRKGTETYTVTWGSPKDSVPDSYEKFYSAFMATIPANMRLKK